MLPKFVRAVLGNASFPTRVGQGLPDPGVKDHNPPPKPTPADRVEALTPTHKLKPPKRNL